MSSANYQATGSTPLYDESVALLGTVIAKRSSPTAACRRAA